VVLPGQARQAHQIDIDGGAYGEELSSRLEQTTDEVGEQSPWSVECDHAGPGL